MCKFKTNNFLMHEEVNKYLESIIETKLFANGYIFYGAEGIGKKETALNFVKKIFKKYSSNGNVEEKINNKNHPDFLIIEPSSFIKGKAALSDVETFAITPTKTGVDVTIGYSDMNSNRISIAVQSGAVDLENPVIFNADLFKEVLNANKECSKATLQVSAKGLAFVEFNTS